MHNAARKLKARSVWQEFGEVIAIKPSCFRVLTSMGEFDATRAVGCLVEPEMGDRVLVVSEEDGESFILSVLSRQDTRTTNISVAEGDLVMRATQGQVIIAGQTGVDVLTGGTANIAASAVEVRAARGKFAVLWLETLSETVKAELGRVKLAAEAFDSVLGRFSQRAKRSYRTVEEIDQVRANQIDYAAEGNARIKGENALLTATDVAKINGEQVHLG
jgi:Protein of unknown function (DUF3540)